MIAKTQPKDTRPLNGYVAFYRGKQKEVYASTSYEAQQKAAKLFKARKSYEVTVGLCETGCPAEGEPGKQVTHVADF
jgi:hypothetical protein